MCACLLALVEVLASEVLPLVTWKVDLLVPSAAGLGDLEGKSAEANAMCGDRHVAAVCEGEQTGSFKVSVLRIAI